MRSQTQKQGYRKFAAFPYFLAIAAISWAATMIAGTVDAHPQANASIVVDHQILISSFAFTPSTILVSKGDRITWVNLDLVPHNITMSDGKKMLSPNLANSEKYTIIVESTLYYECGLHPPMTGKIVIEQDPD